MAGKGGGAWKVAYADFVTAMMAFFLVMWITSQDQKIKEAVTHYFVEPMGYVSIGSSDKPSTSQAIFDGSIGTVPGGTTAHLGRGRMSNTDNGAFGPVTKTVSEWITSEDSRFSEWRDKAKAAKSDARRSYEVLVEKSDAHEVAVENLAAQLQVRFAEQAPVGDGVYSDLIRESLDVVQWREIAEDLLDE